MHTWRRWLIGLMAVSLLVLEISAASYQRGSSGDAVKQIQQKLSSWGYYNGRIDGIYGSKTEAAVRWFQQKNGLTVDGKAGKQTLAAMGISSGGSANGDGDVYLLARLISAEARGEPYEGQVAVWSII